MTQEFDSLLTAEERALVESLDTPYAIQTFLNSTTYRAADDDISPLRVLRERHAHCLDGGLFGAAMLRRLGFPPLLVDMFPDPGMDDDHVLAVFQVEGHWGCVAKSNFVGLRYREPIYRTIRELVLSYFEQFYNLNGVRSLRTFTRPINLTRLDRYHWETTDSGAVQVEKRLLAARRTRLISEAQAARLNPIDELSYKAYMMGVNEAGIYRPKA